ncbi:MAG: DNA primase [Clostridia bacterium]|nr:DNA primase [Clostridia bacterium]
MADKGYSPEWLSELKSRNDIISVVSKYINLDRKGRNHWGCCPFHYEKTPSFSVNEVDQYYHCFGCGASGDVINFVQKYEGIDFWEAVKILAKNVGMEVPTLSNSDDIQKKKAERDKALHALRDAAIFYRDMLNSPRGKSAMDYLVKRGVLPRSIATFGLGYSPDFECMQKHLLEKGYDLDILKKAGLIDSSNGRTYDAFGGRLMFPLINVHGDVVGFSGRLIEDKPFAKYKNSAQNIVFDKSRTVFGINLLKKLKNELRGDIPCTILVEGQLDVVSMHQNGFRNAVACLGTAVTLNHAQELERMSRNVVIMLDGDEAGKKATLRTIDILLQTDLSVKVAVLPDGADPDEFLKKYGKESLQRIIDNAIEAIDYKITQLSLNYNLESNEQKAKFIAEALAIINSLKNEAQKEIYLGLLRKLTNIPVDILRQDMKKAQNTPTTEQLKPVIVEDHKANEDAYILADKFLLASLLHRKEYADIEQCKGVEFIDYDFSKLFNYVKQGTKEKPALVSGVFDIFEIEQKPQIKDIINFEFANNEQDSKVWKDCIFKNKQRKLEMQKDWLEKELKTADLTRRAELLRQMREIDISKIELQKQKDKI